MGNVIYKTVNKLNGKVIIGATINVKKRRSGHITNLRHNKHENKYLQADYNINGEDAFVFCEVIEVLPSGCTWEYRYEREDHWMNEYNSLDRRFGYNQAKAGIPPPSAGNKKNR